MRPICRPCMRETRVMRNSDILRVEVGGQYHETYQADRYGCPDCNTQIWAGFGKPYYAPDGKADYVIRM